MVDLLVFGSAKVVIFMEKGKSVDKKKLLSPAFHQAVEQSSLCLRSVKPDQSGTSSLSVETGRIASS